jgi:hypothetical protein
MREVKRIAFNGVEFPMSFNRYALGRFMRDQGISISQMNELPEDLETVQKLAYFGIVGGFAAEKGKDPDLTYIQFCLDYADDSDGLNLAMELFAEQQAEQDEGGTEKKPKATASKK